MDIQQHAQTTASPSAQVSTPAAWPVAAARPVMPVYSVDERLRRRDTRLLIGRTVLFVLDAAMLNVAFFAAYYLRFVVLRGVQFSSPFFLEPVNQFQQLQIGTTAGLLLIFAVKGLYRLRPTGTWFRQFWIVTSSTTIAFAAFSAYTYIFSNTDLFVSSQRALVAFVWIAVIVFVSFARLLVSGILASLYRRGIGLSNLLVVGSGRLGKLMMQQIAASPYLGFRVVGFIHDQENDTADFGRFKALGAMGDLDGVIRDNRIGEVIIALPSHQHQQILRTVRIAERAGANFRLVPDLYELSLSRIDVDSVEGIPLIGLKRSLTNSWQYGVKRAIDIVGALAAIVIGAPIWLLIAVAIKLDSPGPVFYKQTRLGYRGEPFSFYKFRSMHVDADRVHQQIIMATEGDERGKSKVRDDPRRTRVGRFIRKTSLDEVPNILNVLKGEMSLVGPRPPLPSEFERYEEWERARLEMPPGITGLWQVRGRSDLDFNEMVLMDLYYIENWSLRLDVQILLQTVPAVLTRRGAY